MAFPVEEPIIGRRCSAFIALFYPVSHLRDENCHEAVACDGDELHRTLLQRWGWPTYGKKGVH